VQEVFIKVYKARSRPRRRFSPVLQVILNTGATTGAGARRASGSWTSSSRSRRPGLPIRPPARPTLRCAKRSPACPPSCASAVALRYFADLPLEEIARAQDIPVAL